jgi:hypothetical protein
MQHFPTKKNSACRGNWAMRNENTFIISKMEIDFLLDYGSCVNGLDEQLNSSVAIQIAYKNIIIILLHNSSAAETSKDTC